MNVLAILAILALLIIISYVLIGNSESYSFWKIVQKYPEEAVSFFESKSCWRVFYGTLDQGTRKEVDPDQWAGPFSFYLPATGTKVAVFGLIGSYEESEKEFMLAVNTVSKAIGSRTQRNTEFTGRDNAQHFNKIYMPQDVFEVGAALSAQLYLLSGDNLGLLCQKMWDWYSKFIIDDNVVSDWVKASQSGIESLRRSIEARGLTDLYEAEGMNVSMSDFFRHFQWYRMHYDENGKYKQTDGPISILSRESIRNVNRVNDYNKRIVSYFLGILIGNVPLAPEGWTIARSGGA